MVNDAYFPQARVREGAHIDAMETYHHMYDRSLKDADGFWSEMAREHLTWQKDFTKTQKVDLNKGQIAWFLEGQLNVCENCIDRHLEQRGDKTAILWEGDEPCQLRKISYRELHQGVCRMANVLKSKGLGKGDRIAIYMPMIPEAAMAMLACARIGAVHSVVFAGFSAEALRDRMNDASCKAVITADEGLRGKKVIPLKRTVDKALEHCESVDHAFVFPHTGADVPFNTSRDIDLKAAMAEASDQCPVEVMDSEDILFLLYTSGSTGSPKGIAHSSAGYLLYASLTHRHAFDIREEDVYACVADIGWITGHSYVVYGPLANGATTVMFESVPTYPDSGRYWDMVERLKITQFYTAPTAIRAIAKDGDEFVRKYDRSSLRVLGSVGEPINPDVWKWYYEVVGERQCQVVDTWWQTETGGIMICPLPGATPTKPGSATLPFFGIEPAILDEKGRECQGNGVSGLLVMKRAWPSMARTIYGNHQRFLETYLKPYEGYYFTGDGCRRDEDGYYWITGRVDDVINVSGHRMGTAEVESALVENDACSEAAVVGFPHDIKGQGIFAYVILKDGFEESPELVKALKNEVRQRIGAIASPDHILVSPGLPKTRSGKIMRRILRKVASLDSDQLGDTSTLAEPEIVDVLIEKRHQLG